jgi:hypothetical protein
MPVTTPDVDSLKGIVPVNTSGWAIAAGYLGLLSPVPIFAPFAIITGVVALIHLKKNPGMSGTVRAWVGIVMGVLCTLIYIAVLVSVSVR